MSLSCSPSVLAARSTETPPTGIELEPPVPAPLLMRSVSPCTMRTRSGGRPSCSAIDLRIRRRMPLPGRLRADQQRDAAVAVERERRRLGPVIAAGLDIGRNADAAQTPGAPRLRRALVEAVPVGKLLRARQRAGEIAGVVDLAGRCLVRQRFRLDEVAAADRIGRDVEIVRDGIDRALDQIRGLRPPGAAIGIDRHRVGVDRPQTHMRNRDVVEARSPCRRRARECKAHRPTDRRPCRR